MIGSYPAPYRVTVFKRLSDYYDLTVFFDTEKNENRSKEWFVRDKTFFSVLNKREPRKQFIKSLLRIRDYDFVIPYDALRKPSIAAILMCKLFRIPYFVNCDGAIIKRNAIKDAIKRFLFSGGAAFFSSGKAATEYFMTCGVPRNKIFEHHFTSLQEEDFLKTPLSQEQKSKIRNELGLQDKITFLTIGQFIPRKGIDILLKAWNIANIKDCQLVIIGGGDEKPLYMEMIEEMKADNIIVLDYMNKDEIFKYYDAADVFVLPTREDIWGLVVNEAMARALPVISTDNCVAAKELIDEGLGGYIVPVEDAEQLANRMRILAEAPERCAEMGCYNLKKESGFTVFRIADEHYRVIQKVLDY